jgi:hypothetical protein
MSLCYDFQRSVILGLTVVCISLSVGMLLQYAHGQVNQTTPYVDCVSMKQEGMFVQLQVSYKCNQQQWNEAIQYYKVNGYPNEDLYTDLDRKFMELDSDKFLNFKTNFANQSKDDIDKLDKLLESMK